MNPNFHDWLNLLIRWAHLITGIMWIGTSLYFVWMDSAFEALPVPKKGVDGELFMVHGGNFYHVEKRRFGAGEIPKNLHWFIWEATFTWVTGFFLLGVVYYMTNGAYLIDPSVSQITPVQASFVGMGVLVGGWIFYDLLFRSRIGKTVYADFVLLAFIGCVIYGLTHLFSGRGAYIHIGAMMGTMMVLNVWVHILPNQKAIIEAANAGKEPDYELGKKAKRRSMHNSYMTLPVLFIMLSNHYASTYGNKLNWLVLILIIFMGAMVRHMMITMKKWPLIPVLTTLGVLVWMTGSANQPHAHRDQKVTFLQAKAIIDQRCIACHSMNPTDDVFKVAPNGVMLDGPEKIKSMSARIMERAVVQKTMPLANKTKMTDEERMTIQSWIDQGANIE